MPKPVLRAGYSVWRVCTYLVSLLVRPVQRSGGLINQGWKNGSPSRGFTVKFPLFDLLAIVYHQTFPSTVGVSLSNFHFFDLLPIIYHQTFPSRGFTCQISKKKQAKQAKQAISSSASINISPWHIYAHAYCTASRHLCWQPQQASSKHYSRPLPAVKTLAMPYICI